MDVGVCFFLHSWGGGDGLLLGLWTVMMMQGGAASCLRGDTAMRYDSSCINAIIHVDHTKFILVSASM
jgi:hypothetical protein